MAKILIGADGGGNTCMELGVRPDVVIGDLDSFDVEKYPDLNIIHDSDQETNDLEKALDLARERGAETVVVLGATGARFDHALKNISVLVRYNSVFQDVVFKDDRCLMRILPRRFRDEIGKNVTISLFPVSGKVEGIVTKGLAFPLNGESLENGVRDGSSNRTMDASVEINHESGDLLMMVYHGI